MGIFKRLRDVSLASINSLIDKVEDPVKMIGQYLKDMEADITDAEVAVAKQIAMTNKFKQQLNEATELSAKRESQATQALKKGEEDLAKEALTDKQKYDAQVREFKSLYDTNHATADQLKAQLLEMKKGYDELKVRKSTLEARAESAKAQKHMAEATSGFGKDNAVKGFERMENKVLQFEAEAEAAKELSGSNEKSLDDKFAALDVNPVDDELAALKKKLEME